MEKKHSDLEQAQLEISKFAYEAIALSVAAQKEDLKSIRNQASIVSAVNGLIVTFLSGFVFEVFKLREFSNDDADYTLFLGLNLETLIALILFCFSMVLSARILLPTGGWYFDLSSEKIIDVYLNGDGIDMVDFYKKMTKSRVGHFNKNENHLRKVQNELFFAVLFSVFQIPFWLWNLF